MTSYIVIEPGGQVREQHGHPVMDDTVVCHGGRVLRMQDTAETGPGASMLALVACDESGLPGDRRHRANPTAMAVAQTLGFDPPQRLRGQVAIGRFAVDRVAQLPLRPGDLPFLTAIANNDPGLSHALLTAVIHHAITADKPGTDPARPGALAHVIAAYTAEGNPMTPDVSDGAQ